MCYPRKELKRRRIGDGFLTWFSSLDLSTCILKFTTYNVTIDDSMYSAYIYGFMIETNLDGWDVLAGQRAYTWALLILCRLQGITLRLRLRPRA